MEWPVETAQLKQSARRSARSFLRLLPVLVGVLLLASLLTDLVPYLLRAGILGHGRFADMLGADQAGSLATGQPVVSYLLAGELRESGLDLYSISAFIVAWVTVGVITLPAEGSALGWRFALWRNFTAFLFALLVAWLTVTTLGWLP